MVKKASEMKETVKVNMRDGDGQVIVRNLLEKGEYDGKARLVATLIIEKGCSIGEHVHENEEEIFYIVDGVATYNDNGKTVIMNKCDSCICRSGEKHGIANNGETTLTVAATILTL